MQRSGIREHSPAMVRYRRAIAAAGTFFFTVALRDRSAATLVEHVDPLRDAFRATRRRRPFTIDAIVVLPEHLHAAWTLPEGDTDYSGRWRAIKACFVHSLRTGGADIGFNAKGEADIWQRRFWEHQIRDEDDLARHVDYIDINPVKHRWVDRAAAWPHSSIHRYIRRGWLAPDWGVDPRIDDEFGE
jgi:putative transposase